MFVSDTQIFTNSGWKAIEDISGNDKVLVRNFIGDAEFIQPFALHKKKYDGEVMKLSGKDWGFTVTPDHLVVYGTKNVISDTIHTTPASEIKARSHFKLNRKFKYMFSDEPRKEYITIYDEFGKRSTTISHYDWYKLTAWVLMRGYVYTKQKRPILWLFLDEYRIEQEIAELSDIFDRIGIGYHVQYSEKTRPKLVVSSRNNLVARFKTRLGSMKRKYMSLPDKTVYSSSKELTKLLIETIIDLSIKPETKRTDKYQLSTTNIDLINSLELFGTLGGYGMRHTLKTKAGTPTPAGKTQRDGYILHISAPVSSYSIKNVQKSLYSGYIYGLDLFDGQVYVKQGLNAVWVNPK